MSGACTIRWAALAAAFAGAAAFAAVALTLAPANAAAQIVDTMQTPVDSVIVLPGANAAVLAASPDTVAPITPRGAFIRSMVVPGWGQSAFGSYFRGGIYFAGWAANWFMIFRNEVRLDEARFRFDMRLDQIEAMLLAESTNPDSLRAAMERDPSILEAAVDADDGPGNTGSNLRNVVNSREQQREDWIAWAIFWVLASGIDGYVTAHLSDFPADIEVRRNADRSVSMGLRVPLPGSAP